LEILIASDSGKTSCRAVKEIEYQSNSMVKVMKF